MNKLLSLLLSLAGFGGCNHSPTSHLSPAASPDWEETTMIEYRYGDSSVAPDYQRNYVITVTDSTKSLVVDSYGDVLLTKHYPNTPSDFQALKDELSRQDIYKHEEREGDPCDGGTTEVLRLYKSGVKYFDAYVYHCSGGSGTLLLPDEAAALIRSQIPEDVDSLIYTPI